MSDIKILSMTEAILKRPSMYIGTLHLDRMECFMLGLTTGLSVNDSASCIQHRMEWSEFCIWIIQKHYRRQHSAIGALGLIAQKFGWKKKGFKELIRLWGVYKEKNP